MRKGAHKKRRSLRPPYLYAVTTSDAGAGSLVITAPVKPAWLILTDHGDGTATLAGMPGNGDVGGNAVTLAVSDGLSQTQ